MEIKLRNEDVAELINVLKRDLSERENDAARAEMCLRADFVTERKILISKLVDALKSDAVYTEGVKDGN